MTIEDSIVPLPAESMVKETFGSKNRTVLDSRTTINTNITGRAASRIWTKGILMNIVPDFSNKLFLHVRMPKTNIGKNTKKRGSMILKVLEINKNPRNTIEETNKRCFASFEIIIMNG